MGPKTARTLTHVQVLRHLPQGLFVERDDGQQGIIRAREISWDEEVISNWRDIYPIGWSGYALLIPSQKGEVHEYSLRLAESDPWDQLSDDLQKGQVYEGVITSVVDYGAFVEIVPGLTGLLHYTQLPSWCKRSPLDLFWPGDKIHVTIREAIREQRQIRFGIPNQKSIEEEILPRPNTSPVIARDVDNELEKLLGTDSPKRHILVVENEKPQSLAVAGWLRRLNQRVDVVEDAETAVDFLEKTQPDLALVDVGLPGMSGTDLAGYILDRYPQVQVINVTDWARANEIMATLETLQTRGVKILLKPLLPEDMVPYLLREQVSFSKVQEEERVSDKLTLADVPKLDANKSIQILLERCRERLSFEQVILFSLDPIHRRVKVEERTGDGFLNKSAVPYLIYSPVRDVAEDRQAVVVHEMGERERNRFKYLTELCPSMVSCIGVPVQAQTSFEYALFVMDKRSHQITNEQQLYVEGMALAIGTALEQNNMREKFIMMQRTALIGHLTRAMMHEINNLVGPLLYEADTLKHNLLQYERNPERQGFEGIHNEVQQIQQDVRKVINTTRTFGRIVAKGKPEIIRVDEIILETLGLLKDISDRAHVVLHFQPPEQLIVVKSHAVILEQVFLNVVLNSIQQIAELRPDSGGWVRITLEKTNTSQGNMCRILVEDNGPGIHASWWKKIFDAGFTTRQDGSGIGLYISYNLMEDIRGNIRVLKSHILSGSTFSLEFPIHL